MRKSDPIDKPPSMKVSNDEIPDGVKRRVPLALSRVPDGNRAADVGGGAVVAETFFLNVIDIVDNEQVRNLWLVYAVVCAKELDGCLFWSRSSLENFPLDNVRRRCHQ